MKKYNIRDLNIVKVNSDNKDWYFICKRSNTSNTYIEIFTNKKISIENKAEPLSTFYSIFEQFNEKTGKTLILDKYELMKKYMEINNYFNKNDKYTNEEVLFKINKRLDDAAINFFPEDGECSIRYVFKPKELFQSHLRDVNYLASKLQKEAKLEDIEFIRILDYVKTSKLFNNERSNYEQRIVKWEIEYILNGGNCWITDEKYSSEFIRFSKFWDIVFRKAVVDTLLYVGIDRQAIEEGLEKNSDLWRDRCISSAFKNEYDSIWHHFYYSPGGQKNQNYELKLENADPEHKEKWMKMRKYEYYKNHKKSVDMYGVAEPEMLMTDEEVKELKKYLDKKNAERKKRIEEFHEAKQNSYNHIPTKKNKVLNNKNRAK